MNKKTIAILLCAGAVFCALFIFSVIAAFQGFSKMIPGGPDQMFGDQHLKTTVALLELHKVRYKKYPASLKDLKFIGDWDLIALRSVSYLPNKDRTAYYVEVQRGWIGKPHLEMPREFWQGTGYRPKEVITAEGA